MVTRTSRVADGLASRVRRVIAANNDLLTDLDSAIGDADHGTNLDRGMTAVLAALDESALRRLWPACFKQLA